MQETGRQIYADVIVDVSHERLDRVYQYRVPAHLAGSVTPGTCVEVPFGSGNRRTRAYVLSLSGSTTWDPEKIKDIEAVSRKGITIESRLIELAVWIRQTYGCTMIQALRTVLPVKEKTAGRRQNFLQLDVSRDAAEQLKQEAEQKGHRAKARLLEELLAVPVLPQAVCARELNIGSSTIASLARAGVIRVMDDRPGKRVGFLEIHTKSAGEAPSAEGQGPPSGKRPVLSAEQRAAVDRILENWREEEGKPCLIEGVTGSGKTLVYMELAEQILREGREVIILIPEISLSWQNVRRFRERFGDIVTVIHSRMSKSERYGHYEAVSGGRAKIAIGPRSALFTPFPKPGLIILDEEQEGAYRSEETPRYDAREAAIARARIEGAHVVFGSATPSLDSAWRARSGKWLHVRLRERFGTAQLPDVQIVDMRSEMREGNRTMISGQLRDEIGRRLQKGEQTILFLNKRGLAGFLSCRSCGTVLKCPHCDVSLTAHRNGMLLCHYCGYKTPQISICPACGSPHIYGFRAGTQKAEQTVFRMFPDARILRMDADTTKGREGHDRILKAFAAREADILIGTQMIVKGHDFPGVTLVGALLADLSLFVSDYRAAERTYQLIVQAVGRAGRGAAGGSAVIQTYNPDHYSIIAAAEQNFEAFYRRETEVRSLLQYPPSAHLLVIHMSARDERRLAEAASYVKRYLERIRGSREVRIIGPAPESIAKVQEYYRAAISLKAGQRGELIRLRRGLESYIEINSGFDEIRIQYDLDR